MKYAYPTSLLTLIFQSNINYFYDNVIIIERSNYQFGRMIKKKVLPECDTGKILDEFIDGFEVDTNYACWCGKDTVNSKMYRPKNELDRICRAHDICYDKFISKGCIKPYRLSYSWKYKKSSNTVGYHFFLYYALWFFR